MGVIKIDVGDMFLLVIVTLIMSLFFIVLFGSFAMDDDAELTCSENNLTFVDCYKNERCFENGRVRCVTYLENATRIELWINDTRHDKYRWWFG